ncbi:alpha-amylase family glycosyl hydrolase [Amylolactobacillus amylophilus]|uniref:alpha-amylase family glycosyl hydrolase n=1 Tax=Amylolactobacillus amylophilus TaxID=1603 RepID=UPI002093EE53|nr:alpha-amylase family glycosyl hydrolase [Amylolactobacillus amylophilus]
MQTVPKKHRPIIGSHFFGTSAWEYVPHLKQSYLHIFAKQQPDLNWKNAKMRTEIYEMIRFWLNLGLDGFRLDAISHIQKKNWAVPMDKDDKWRNFMNVPGIEQYMSELKEIFDEYHILTVGEASGVSSKKAPEWTGEKGYINMIFELEHNLKTGSKGHEVIDIPRYQDVIYRWQRDQLTHGWNALYIENHDNPRAATIFNTTSPSAIKTLALSYLLLRGTPFIYQGQEIGMTNFPFAAIEQFDAVDAKLQYHEALKAGINSKQALNRIGRLSRDNSRTPMQWDNTKKMPVSQSVIPGYQLILIGPT